MLPDPNGTKLRRFWEILLILSRAAANEARRACPKLAGGESPRNRPRREHAPKGRKRFFERYGLLWDLLNLVPFLPDPEFLHKAGDFASELFFQDTSVVSGKFLQ
jgi:hypothetical protein